MKQTCLALLLLVLLSGCGAGNGEEGFQMELLPADLLAPAVYDAMENEWARWNALSEAQQELSSRMPGWCQQSFDDWAACEEFFGVSIPNPLEACDWLEKGTCAGMPLDDTDTPRVCADWYGGEDGGVDWISIGTGYRDGEIRVMFSAQLFTTQAAFQNTSWPAELERQDAPSRLDGAAPQITADSGERYSASRALLVRGRVLYGLDAIGTPDRQAQAEAAMERALALFPVLDEAA